MDFTYSFLGRRHSEKLLPRLDPSNVAYRDGAGLVGSYKQMPAHFNCPARSIMWANSAAFLGASTWRLLHPSFWEEDLCDGFLVAYSQAINGILFDMRDKSGKMEADENTRGKNSREGSDDDNRNEIDYDGSTRGKKIEEEKEKADYGKDFAVNFRGNLASSSDDDGDMRNEIEEGSPQVDLMLESRLRELYLSARRHAPPNIEVRLASHPVSAELSNLFMIPFVSREEVEKTPSLRRSFGDVLNHFRKFQGTGLKSTKELPKLISMLETMGRNQASRNRGIVECTVIAQVSINCREIFSVKDTNLGLVLQGGSDSLIKNVTHLVRFEMTVSVPLEEVGPPRIGCWVITDFDDLLDGNTWFF